MLFHASGGTLSNIQKSTWTPSEKEVENLIFPNYTEAPEIQEITTQIFHEEILLLEKQKSFAPKRSDIIGIDSYGQGVIIELKKDAGALGVDTQALQYLTHLSVYKGQKFLDFLAKKKTVAQSVLDFTELPVERLNESSRIILIARSFDPALFSMGRWLESKGVGFKCISYEPIVVDDEKFLNFSVAFSASPMDEYAFSAFQRLQPRAPSVFWHNIGNAEESWWDYLRKEKVVTTSYANLNDPSCIGYRKLHQYVKDDGILAFVSGVGVVGYGRVIESPEVGYAYKDHGLSDYSQRHFHHLQVDWLQSVDFKDAIQPSELREKFGLNWPSGTKQVINNKQGAVELQKELRARGSR